MDELSKIQEQMTVVASDGRIIGKVSALGGAGIKVTSLKEGRGFDHSIPASWIAEVGKYVFLDKNSQFVSMNCDGDTTAHQQIDPRAAA